MSDNQGEGTLAVAIVTWLPFLWQTDTATPASITSLRFGLRVIWGGVRSSQRGDGAYIVLTFDSNV